MNLFPVVGLFVVAIGGLMLGQADADHSDGEEQPALPALRMTGAALIILGIAVLGAVYGRAI